MKTMILAAGLGTRLLPYTEKRPKPLFPVLNRPLLSLTVARLRASCSEKTVINSHHLPEQIKAALQDETGVILQEESSILGTGGGLRKAVDHFGTAPFLVVNGDIYHTLDYREVYDSHCESGADITLVLHDYPRFNDVTVNGIQVTGFNTKAQTGRDRLLAFTGIHVISPEIIRDIPPDSFSCIIDCYRKLLDKGGTIRAHVAEEHFWTDMGTPEDYLSLHCGLLTGTIPVYKELEGELRGKPFVGWQDASRNRKVGVEEWVCIGRDVTIGKNVSLKRSVVWDGAVIPDNSVIRDAIVTG